MRSFGFDDTVTAGSFRAEQEEKDMPLCGDTEEILHIPYTNRDGVPLGMDIFRPAAEEGTALPVIVAIRGGLTADDRKRSRAFGRTLAGRGYLVFSVECRTAPSADVRMQLDDVCAGLALADRKLAEFDVDFDRVFIAAESTGAFAAVYAAAMQESEKLRKAIGYEPMSLSFSAIGLMSGMLYPRENGFAGRRYSEQVRGNKAPDEDLSRYMDPEDPEILDNLPPVYLITARGDMLNHYSIRMNEALKRAGKPCHILYCGDKDLGRDFTVTQAEDPRSAEAVDKMLVWFEERAAMNADREKNAKALQAGRERYAASLAAGRRNNQRISAFIRECASKVPDRGSMPAIMDCAGTYTYAQMFKKWDEYARVFTALHITEADHSRAALVGTISAETLFAYYGLNTVGACVSMFSYPDLLPGGRWKTMLEKEHITDMVVTDIMVTPQMWEELKRAKAEFGLRNIILLHSRMGGPCIGYAEMLYNEFNYNALRRMPDVLFMDDLIEKYTDVEISRAKRSGRYVAVICHTSGTANGTRKPLPFTDSMINGIVSALGCAPLLQENGVKKAGLRMVLPFDCSSAMSINGMVNCTFAQGSALVLTFFGFMHPKFVRCFKYYGVQSAFTSGFMLEKWTQMTDLAPDAFASVKTFGIGGSYLPAPKMEKYKAFLQEHGFKGSIYQGYGMSELGDLSLLAPEGCSEDILGYPSDAEAFRVQDETDGKFYKTTDGVRTGILYGHSASMCLNVLDGEKLFDLTEIDGKNFLCTNDCVRVNEDGSLSYAGRANRFFANSQGVRFEAGEAETLLSAHPAVNTCAFVPVLDKRIHDTVPVLYAIPEHKGAQAPKEICGAVEDVFVKGDRLSDSVLPSQFILVDDIPCNSNGKVDVYHITRNRLKGTAYNIIPVKDGGTVTGLRYESAEQMTSYTGGTLPEGMGRDSAFRVFDLFSNSAGPRGGQTRAKFADACGAMKETCDTMLRGLLETMPKNSRQTSGKMKDIMTSVCGSVYDQDMIDHDFEE